MDFYNEIEPKMAAWIRELMAGGLIPAGTVDERSICDVKPDDIREFDRCHWFAGLAGCDESGMELTESQRRREEGRCGTGQTERIGERCDARDFWSSSIWWPCRDGKYRRIPAQSVVLGLAPGAAPRVDYDRPESGFPLCKAFKGRSHLLKGIGNAINIRVAATFVRAVMSL
jgi:hypothetical protein